MLNDQIDGNEAQDYCWFYYYAIEFCVGHTNVPEQTKKKKHRVGINYLCAHFRSEWSTSTQAFNQRV